MKLPSLNYLMSSAKTSFLRFPLSIISSLMASVLGIYLLEDKNETLNIFPYVNLMLCFAIGIPLYFCVTILVDKEKLNKKIALLLFLVSSVILVLIYLSFPNSQSAQITSQPYAKYVIYNISIHLLVSFIPFVSKQKLNGFWNYNKILFLRFWTSFLFSSVICCGLCMALFAVNQLFNLKMNDRLYLDIQILTYGFFNTWFFVSGIPENFDVLDEIYEYPKGLKIFSQYILLPLLILYLAILYLYGTKILFYWSWPSGLVSYLIIFVSILGILTFLLIYPYGNSTENTWIKRISKIYYFTLLPLIVLLFIAIFMRINDYGITVSRYLILMLGVWLTVVCLYFITGKTNIKFIPISLATLLILISFGPWGMFSLSERHQVNRLQKLLEGNNMLKNGKICQEAILKSDTTDGFLFKAEHINEGLLSDSLHNEVLSILNYLDKHHGFGSIKSWYKQDIDSIFKFNTSVLNKEKWGYYSESELYTMALGLTNEYRYQEEEEELVNAYYNYSSTANNVTAIKNYDYLIYFNQNREDVQPNDSIINFKIGGTDYNFMYSFTPADTLWLKTQDMSLPLLLNDLVVRLNKEFGTTDQTIPEYKMRIENDNDFMEVKCEFSNIELENRKDTLKINSISGNLFIKMK